MNNIDILFQQLKNIIETVYKDYLQKVNRIKKIYINYKSGNLINFFNYFNIKKIILIKENKNKNKYNYILIFFIFKLLYKLNIEVNFQNIKTLNTTLCENGGGGEDDFRLFIWEDEKYFKFTHSYLEAERFLELLESLKYDFFESRLKPILSTIENCFNQVAIIGSNALILKIEEYFKKNHNIYFEIKQNIELTWNSRNKYLEITSLNKIDAVINMSLNMFPICYKNKEIFSLDLKRISISGNFGFSESNDLANYVIPMLEASGIKILVVTEPSMNKLNFNVRQKIVKKLRITQKNNTSSHLFSNFIKNQKLFCDFQNVKEKLNYGIFEYNDQRGDFINFVNGNRVTIGNTGKEKNKIFLFGPCIAAGLFASDKNTIASLLRKKVSGYQVLNKGGGCGYYNINLSVRLTKFEAGDIAIIFAPREDNYYECRNINVLNLTRTYSKVKNIEKHIWNHVYHCDKILNQYIAQDIFKYMGEKDLFTTSVPHRKRQSVCFGCNFNRKSEVELLAYPDLNKWLYELENYKMKDLEAIGAIVMNCNPFTKGHQYLIEEASKKVDYLYVFLVEEDKSFFNFKDRMFMTKQGTKQFSNVKVLPSGQYMISAATMPGYFNKNALQNEKLDASEDLKIFGEHIAPCLGIKIRL